MTSILGLRVSRVYHSDARWSCCGGEVIILRGFTTPDQMEVDSAAGDLVDRLHDQEPGQPVTATSPG